MLTFAQLANKPIVFQMLTGLSLEAFWELLPVFERTAAQLEQQAEAQRQHPRQRQPGGGRKPILQHGADRLLEFMQNRRVNMV